MVIVFLAVGYFSSRRTTVFITDLSRHEQLTLTPKSQEILERFKDEKLTLTTYVNIFDEHTAEKVLPKNRIGDMSAFSMYYRFKPDMEFKYVYYYNYLYPFKVPAPGENLEEDAKKQAKVKGINFDDVLSPDEINEIWDLSSENNQVVRVLEDGDGNWTYLRMFNDLDPYPSEQEISVALKRMKEGPIKIGSLTGHGERALNKQGDREIGGLYTAGSNRGAIVNQGFDVNNVVLSEEQSIPDSIQGLLIIDPKEPFTEKELEHIRDYVASGRNLVIATDVNRSEVMDRLLSDFGVKALPGILVQPREDYIPTNIFSYFETSGKSVSPSIGGWASQRVPLSMAGAVALDYTEDKGYKVNPFIYTDNKAWVEVETTDFEGDSLVCNEKAGEFKQKHPVGLELTRELNGKEQRIMILGDADWMTSGEFAKRRAFGTANMALTTTMCSWMGYNKYPIYFPRPGQPDNQISLKYQSKGLIKIAFNVIFPVLILLLYLLVWIKRRGK